MGHVHWQPQAEMAAHVRTFPPSLQSSWECPKVLSVMSTPPQIHLSEHIHSTPQSKGTAADAEHHKDTR